MKKLIKFEKEGCVPCKMVDSLLNSKDIKTEKIDVLSDSESVELYGVSSVPVVILLDDGGNEVARSIGFNPPELENMINLLNN